MLVSMVSERGASKRRSRALRRIFIAEPLNLHSHIPEFTTLYASYLSRILQKKLFFRLSFWQMPFHRAA